MTQAGQPHDKDRAHALTEPWVDADDAREPAVIEPESARTTPGRSMRLSQGLTETITSTEHIPGPSGFYYADVPNRIMAMIIDIIVLTIAGFVLASLLGGLVSRPGSLDAAGGELQIVPFVVVLLLELAISLLYFGYMWVTVRATVGMKLLGLQIGDQTDGHSISPRQALVRWLIIGVPSVLVSLGIFVPSIVGLILSLIGLALLALLLYSVARSHTKQGLHDRYARTIMIKQRRRAT